MMYYSDDPARDAERYMADLDKKLERRPMCYHCGHHIQADSAFHYNGVWLCDDCIDSLREEIEVDE
jgi:ribosomal protein L37AE/L43A